MTKAEREMIQGFINTIGMYREQSDKAFKELQELNGTKGTGTRWCCAKANYEDIVRTYHDNPYSPIVNRAGVLYDDYVKSNERETILMDLGSRLANLGFWKKVK